MKILLSLVPILGLSLAACQQDEGSSKNLGEQTAGVISDTRVLKEAQAAANDLVRNAGDCQAVQEKAAGVNQKLDQAAGDVQTVTGRTTLEALRKRVHDIEEVCGVR